MASAAIGTAFRHLRDLFASGSVAGLEDGPLLARFCQSKDAAAFEALVGRHGPMVLATCRAVLKVEQDAEDAFQATFLVLARKAGSIRAPETLGGWLHRVAYRASVQASVRQRKRRRKEAEASAMASMDASRPVPQVDFELRPILHEEIDRLPEGQRLPVVLCDLEGLTYEQAADQLRWTVPTLRCRLAKARQKLRDRLVRRGLDPLAVGPLVVPQPAFASVPPALLKATVLAATGGAASAGAGLLAHTLLRGMLMTKIKIAGTVALTVLGLASAGLIAAGAIRPEDGQPVMKPAVATSAPAAKDALKPTGPGEVAEIRGLVVDPAGKPIAGATIRIGFHDFAEATLPEVSSGPDGRFTIGVPVSSGRAADANNYRFPWLVASAPGFGPGHVESVLKPGAASPTIRLVEEGPPIEGRVVDLEGRPVAGAKVASEEVWFEPRGDLAGWLARIRDHGTRGTWDGLMQLPMKLETRADADGRFRLAGFGRDRIAELMISAPTIATKQAYVQTRDAGEVRAANTQMMSSGAPTFHAPRFQHVAAPTKPIEGTILDKDSNRPLAGWVIHGMVYDESSHIWTPGVEATTDAEGRYRLTGLAKAASYRLFLNPGKGQPYTKGTVVTQAVSPGLDPVPFDIKLKHGVLVRGRVTDKATGLPATGFVNAYTLESNPHLSEFPGYSGSYGSQVDLDADGRFEVATPPGPGIIACRSNDRLYRGAEVGSIKAPFDPRMQSFATEPAQCNIGDYHALAEVDLDPQAESATVDLQLDPGRTLEVAVVDAEGHPVGDTRASGLRDLFPGSIQPQESATLQVRSLAPGKPRRVIVRHKGRKLVGSLYLKGDEDGPLTLRLQPWGTITGRVVDDEGRPRKDVRLSSLGGIYPDRPEIHGVLPASEDGVGHTVDTDGRFRVEGLIPGLKYGADAIRGFMGQSHAFKDVTVAPGEVTDLGDLKLTPYKED